MSTSGVCRRVTFSDEGSESKVPRHNQQPKKQTTECSADDIKTKRYVKSSTVPKSQSVRRTLASVSSGSSSNSTNVTKKKPGVKKTLVRDTSQGKPQEKAKISRATTGQVENQLPSFSQMRLNLPTDPQDIQQPATLSVPYMQSNLDTARRIQALSELDLETARTQNNYFEIDQDDLLRKVFLIADLNL